MSLSPTIDNSYNIVRKIEKLLLRKLIYHRTVIHGITSMSYLTQDHYTRLYYNSDIYFPTHRGLNRTVINLYREREGGRERDGERKKGSEEGRERGRERKGVRKEGREGGREREGEREKERERVMPIVKGERVKDR